MVALTRRAGVVATTSGNTIPAASAAFSPAHTRIGASGDALSAGRLKSDVGLRRPPAIQQAPLGIRGRSCFPFAVSHRAKASCTWYRARCPHMPVRDAKLGLPVSMQRHATVSLTRKKSARLKRLSHRLLRATGVTAEVYSCPLALRYAQARDAVLVAPGVDTMLIGPPDQPSSACTSSRTFIAPSPSAGIHRYASATRPSRQ